jgi:hypothetical protein
MLKRYLCFKRIAVAAIGGMALIALSGCAREPLDFRNAEVSNGKIYAEGANEPFDGRVTNVPERLIVPKQLAGPGAQFTSPFSAVGNVSWYALDFGADNSLCDTEVEAGLPTGKMVCKYPSSEMVRYELSLESGRLQGGVKYYGPPPSNRLLASAGFDQGRLEGKHEAFHPRTGKKVWEGTWKAGLLDGEETGWYLSTGNMFFKAHYKNGKAEGPVIRYAEDGTTVIYRATFANGLKDGLEESFSTTGKPGNYTQWRAGKKHGVHRYWNWPEKTPWEYQCVEGVCTEVKQAQSSQDAPSTAPAGACVSAWIAVHRNHVGPDAAISAGQIQEWQDWCKEGRRPT